MPSKKLTATYSRYEIEMISTVGKIIAYDFLGDKLSVDEKHEYLKMFDYFRSFSQGNDEAVYEGYGRKYFDPRKKLENKLAYYEVMGTESTVKPALYTKAFESHTLQVFDEFEEFEEPLKDFIGTAKKLSGVFEKFIKEQKDPEQVKFLNAFKDLFNDLCAGRFRKRFSQSSAYMFMEGMTSAYLAMSKPFCVIMQNQEGEYIPTYMEERQADWKGYVEGLKGTGLVDIMAGANRIAKCLDKASDYSLEAREDLIRAYEDYIVDVEKVLGMTQEKYNEINKDDKVLQNNLDEFTDGDRGPIHTLEEAQISIALLKKGFPIEDVIVLTDYYVTMMRIKKAAEGKALDNTNTIVYNQMKEAWDKVMNPPKATRLVSNAYFELHFALENLGKLPKAIQDKDSCFLFAVNVNSERIGETAFTSLKNRIDENMGRQLTYKESWTIDNTVSYEFLHENLKSVDPKSVRSSDEFKKLIGSVEKISKMERKGPEFEVQKLRVMKNAEKYLEYKRLQMNEKGHKRSRLEDDRVKTVNAMLSALKRNNLDILKEPVPDQTVDMSKDITAEQAEKFRECVGLIEIEQTRILNKLIEMKNKLISTQKPGKDGGTTNFENVDEMQGSSTYRRMTQTLQNAIETIQDKNTRPAEIRKALEDLNKECKLYQKEHDSIWSGNYGSKRTVRQAEAEKAIKDIPVMIEAFDQLRVKMAEFTDDKGVAYSYMSLKDAEKVVDTLKTKQLINGEAKDFSEDIKEIEDIATVQMEIREVIRKKYPLFVDNYEPYRSEAYYMALMDKPSVKDIAEMVTIKRAMDKVYAEGVTVEDLQDLKDRTNIADFEEEIKRLSNDALFKSVINSNPNRVIDQWEAIDDEATDMRIEMQRQHNELMGKGLQKEGKEEYYNNAADYCAWNSTGPLNTATMLLREYLISSQGEKVLRILAVSENSKDIMEQLRNEGAEHVREVLDKVKKSFESRENELIFSDNEEEKAKLAEDKREKIYEALSSPKFKKSFIENVLKSTALKLSPKKAVPVANVENEIDAAQNDKQHLPGM